MKRRYIPRVRFNLDRKPGQKAKVFLIFRYPYAGKTIQLKWSCNIEVDEKHWDNDKQRHKVTVASADYKLVNDELDRLEELVISLYREGAKPLSGFKQELRYHLGIDQRPGAPSTFFTDYMAWAIEREAKNVSRNTSKRWYTVLNNLLEFEQSVGHQYTFEEYDFNWLEAFKAWSYDIKDHSKNGVADAIKRIRRFYRRAIDEGATAYNHIIFSRNFMPSKVQTNKPVFYEEDLQQLYDHPFTGKLERIRDLFLIGCYTCLRVSDLKTLAPHHVVHTPDGVMIDIITRKTGAKVAIPCRPQLLALLKKYDFNPPKISEQKYNKYLKEMALVAGFTNDIPWIDSKGGEKRISRVPLYTKVTTHMARRTGATILYLAGWPPAQIMAITGHTTQRQLMEYINVGNRLSAQYSKEHLSKLKVV